MSVISIHRRDPGAFARSILHQLLQHGDLAGRDTAGRTLLQLAVDDWLLDELCAFDAGAEDLEDSDGEPEPQDIDESPVVLDVVRSRQIPAATHCLKALVAALLLVPVLHLEAKAEQAHGVPVLSLMSTAQAPQQCCRFCRKGKACGDGCISAAKQCKRDQGCACSAASRS